MSDLERAKQLLVQNCCTLVLCKADITYTSKEKGVSPMVKLISENTDLNGFCAADRVVGKAAAMLFALAGVKELHTTVISRPAADFLTSAGIKFSYDEMTEYIINRKGDGKCPMELTVMDIDDITEAYLAITKKLDELRKTK